MYVRLNRHGQLKLRQVIWKLGLHQFLLQRPISFPSFLPQQYKYTMHPARRNKIDISVCYVLAYVAHATEIRYLRN